MIFEHNGAHFALFRQTRQIDGVGFLGTPSGSECVHVDAPLRVCAFADSEKTRNIAASCDFMDVPFIEASFAGAWVD